MLRNINADLKKHCIIHPNDSPACRQSHPRLHLSYMLRDINAEFFLQKRFPTVTKDVRLGALNVWLAGRPDRQARPPLCEGGCGTHQ
jgi:hypothetical protein